MMCFAVSINSLSSLASNTPFSGSLEFPCYTLSYGASHLNSEGDLSALIDRSALIGGVMDLKDVSIHSISSDSISSIIVDGLLTSDGIEEGMSDEKELSS